MVQIKVDASFFSKELSSELELLGVTVSDRSKFYLTQSKDKNWLLLDSEKRKLEIDFDLNKHDYNRTHKGSGELMARALGVKDKIKKVVDLTSGLGIDAVLLSQIGFEVTSIERNPLLYFLLKRAQEKSVRKEIQNQQVILNQKVTFSRESS